MLKYLELRKPDDISYQTQPRLASTTLKYNVDSLLR